MTTNHVHVITKDAKNPPVRLSENLLGDCVKLQRSWDSVATLEVVFEPIVHETSKDVRKDSLYEIEHHAHD